MIADVEPRPLLQLKHARTVPIIELDAGTIGGVAGRGRIFALPDAFVASSEFLADGGCSCKAGKKAESSTAGKLSFKQQFA